MPAMSLYHDPSLPYAHPSLGVPATASQHQLENQTTTVLAWLVDHSRVLARSVLGLFLGDYVPAEGSIGARTQLTLPKPGGGAVYPDLSVCMGHHALQLLVEEGRFRVPRLSGVRQCAAGRGLPAPVG